MALLYPLYDALISINVPNDKARAVVDAMERDMLDQVATKADLLAMRTELSAAVQLLTKDVHALEERSELRLKTELADLRHSMTVRLGLMLSGFAVAISGIVGMLQALL